MQPDQGGNGLANRCRPHPGTAAAAAGM